MHEQNGGSKFYTLCPTQLGPKYSRFVQQPSVTMGNSFEIRLGMLATSTSMEHTLAPYPRQYCDYMGPQPPWSTVEGEGAKAQAQQHQHALPQESESTLQRIPQTLETGHRH